MNTGSRKTDRIIRHGKLTAAAQASAVWRSSARRRSTSTGRSSGNVFTQAIAIEIAARAQVIPNRVKKVPASPS